MSDSILTSIDVNISSSPLSPWRNVTARYPGFELDKRFVPEVLWMGRVFFIVWLAIGLPGNALSAKIWLERRMRNSSAIYVAALSINCIAFLLLHLVNALKFLWGIEIYHYPFVCEVLNVLYIMPQYLNQLLILGFTVDRFIAVRYPLRRKDYCRPSRAIKVVIGMVCGATAVTSTYCYFRKYDENKDRCVDRPMNAAMSAWLWITEMLFSLVGPLATMVLNILVIIGVRNARQSRQQRLLQQQNLREPTPEVTSLSKDQSPTAAKTATTATLLSISFFYVLTTLPSTILFIMFPYFEMGSNVMTDSQVLADPTWQKYFLFRQVELVVYELSMSHYVCNIFIFLPTARQFRQSVFEFLTCASSSDYRAPSGNGGHKLV